MSRAPLTDDQIDQLVNFMDLDSEGMVEYEEFLDSFIPVDSYMYREEIATKPVNDGHSGEGNSGKRCTSVEARASGPNAGCDSTSQEKDTANCNSKHSMDVDESSRRFTFSSEVGDS